MLRLLFIISLLISCWLWMQIVHELGHAIGAWCTGGIVKEMELHPLRISRTDVERSSQPLVVIWAGPILGCVLPLLIWLTAASCRFSIAFALRFFAGVCLVTNGLYLAAGSFDGVGDCGDLLRHGSPIWTLWLFGVVTVPSGLLLWHRQGPEFGWGPNPKRITGWLAYPTAIFAAGTALAEFAWLAL